MQRAIDKYRFTVTVNEPKHEYDVNIPADFSLSEVLDRIDTIIENTTEATSYCITVVRKVEMIEEAV